MTQQEQVAIPAPGTIVEKRSPGAAVVAIGGALVALGSFLPWVSVDTAFGSMSRSGIDAGGDGVIALILGVAAGLLGLNMLGVIGEPGHSATTGAIVLGILAGALLVVDYVDVSNRVSDASNQYALASVGAGLYVGIIGAGMVIGGAINVRQRGGQVRKPAATADDPDSPPFWPPPPGWKPGTGSDSLAPDGNS